MIEAADPELTDSIRILLEINDPETVAAYSKCEKSFISDDLLNGNLMDMCDVVSIEANATNGAERSDRAN